MSRDFLTSVLPLVYYRRMAKKKLSVGGAMAALRMIRMTPEERSEVARKAVNVRWARYRAAKKMARKPRARKAA